MEQAVRLSATRPVRWVTGHFDPLLAEHIRRLRGFALPDHALIAIVTSPAVPLLSSRARAELVAALACVDYVVVKDGWAPAEEAEDAEIAARFVERVIRRHRGESE